MGTLELSPDTDDALARFVRTIERDDPESTYAWTQRITDPLKQERVARNVMGTWRQLTPGSRRGMEKCTRNRVDDAKRTLEPVMNSFHRYSLYLGLVSTLLIAAIAFGGNSKLWGTKGELWKADGPLPDFSFAGYQRGEKPIPVRKADVSVADFGAIGDGETDDTAAFLKAISESAGKVIGIPEGHYLITNILEIRKSGTVLQGAGPDKTILVCPKALHEIRPAPITHHAAKTNYSWSGGMVWIRGSSFGRKTLSSINPNAKRGDQSITLEDVASDLKKGDEVIVAVKDDSNQSLLTYLYAKQPGDISKLDAGEEERQQVCRVESVDGKKITLDRPLRFDLLESFQPELRQYDPRLQECGVEKIGFEFPDSAYRGHFSEDGYNAIAIQGAVHCWARDIHILNSDSGIFVSGRFCTAQDIILESKRKPGPKDNTGHHGLSAGGADNLLTRFDFRTKFVHDISVERTTGCVISNGKGIDLNLDHHRRAPYENLFSNLDLGQGDRAFDSGGATGRGHHAAAGNTYWNLRSKEKVLWPENFGPDRQNWIGLNTRERKSNNPEKTEGRWHEKMRPGQIAPADLHTAQLAHRLGTTKPVPSEKAKPNSVQQWVNAEGKKIRATFVRLQGNSVMLKLENGRTVSYPLSKLSKESQKQARDLSSSL